MPKYWSHQVAQQFAASDPDSQEALSRRYGNSVLLLLPLESGRLAVFGNDRQLVAFVEYEELSQSLLEGMAAEASQRLSPKVQPRGQTSELDLDEMGI